MKLNNADLIVLTKSSLKMKCFFVNDDKSRYIVGFKNPDIYDKRPQVFQMGIKNRDVFNKYMDQINNVNTSESLYLLDRNIRNFKEFGLIDEKQADFMKDFARNNLEETVDVETL